MNRKTMMPIDPTTIKARMKERGYTYMYIEERSEGRITEISLKHFLNKGSKADEETLDILADLLACSKNELVAKDYFLSTNLSAEINSIIDKLYLKNREDVNRFYASKVKEFRTNTDLSRMMSQAHRLFLTLSVRDYIFDKSAFEKGFELLTKEFAKENCISNRNLTEITDDVAKSLFEKTTTCSGGYNSVQVILMFLYVFVLFDAIFMEEEVASVTQLVPERKTRKADQYFELAYKSEKMRNLLIDHLVYKGFVFDDPAIIENGIDDIVIEGIMLMLAACEKCCRHINSDFVDSEYLNRSAFSAVLTNLEKVFLKIGIKLPEDNFLNEFVNMNMTRFGRYYNILKVFSKNSNPPQQRTNKELESYKEGMNLALFAMSLFGNDSNK
jgi:hypothetical protein